MLARKEFESIKSQVFMLACQIGLRAAARAFNLKEGRVTKWAQRDKWQISLIRPTTTNAVMPSNVASAREAMLKVMGQMEDRSRLAMARTGMRAFESCDNLSEQELRDRDTAIALQNHGKNLQLAHQWFPNALSSNVAVQVNVPMPSEEERAEMRAMDRKLDAIAAKLKANPTLESK